MATNEIAISDSGNQLREKRNVKVLFLGTSNLLQPWYGDVLKVAAGRWPIPLFDRSQPVAPQFEGLDVVIDQGGNHGTHELIDAACKAGVKLWQVLGTGLDHTDVSYILKKGIPLANTPGQFSSIALAEHALFLMLLFAKKFFDSQRSVHNQVLCEPMNEELSGKTLGLLGFGASGRELATRAKAMGMRIMAIDVVPIPLSVQEAYGLVFGGKPEDLARLLAASDYLSVHMPLTTATRHMLNGAALSAMKPSAVIINVARGEIIDEAALAEALQGGTLRGAALDVFPKEPVDPSHPLLRLANVVATPHVAGVTFGTSYRRAQAVIANVERVAQGLPVLYQVTSVE
jgi:D-3-phosphoglycerate dehydrogenase